ncbi:hypothetical protein NM208_g11421 [Fusarium decemcellulare]|uniref:Uncharacterized protein n=1 Tax=Fusarium decemcellulare TaxID=57161 RepID=A0ACC1RT96_9HYPO|nr:hypothetical protein NM208_g11421 [Fusarium decemcellulare]
MLAFPVANRVEGFREDVCYFGKAQDVAMAAPNNDGDLGNQALVDKLGQIDAANVLDEAEVDKINELKKEIAAWCNTFPLPVEGWRLDCPVSKVPPPLHKATEAIHSPCMR